MKTVLRSLVLTALALVFFAWQSAAQDSDVFILREHTPAPAFTMPDLSGRMVKSTELAGKVAVLSFGATWCPTDGFLFPPVIYGEGLRRAAELGATVLQHTEVLGSERRVLNCRSA